MKVVFWQAIFNVLKFRLQNYFNYEKRGKNKNEEKF